MQPARREWARGRDYVSDRAASRIVAVKDRLGLRRRRTAEPEPDFSTKVPGRLFAIDLKTKATTLITPKPFANIDGLESDGRGGFIVSDWNAGNIAIVPTGSDPPTRLASRP